MLSLFLSGAASLLVLALLIFCLGLQKRLRSTGAKVSASDTLLSRLGAELEAQALLARQMSVDLEELRKHLIGRPETAPASSLGWESAHVPLNLNRRGQILRLSRKGKTVAEIASDLSVAQGEVELLLKVQDLAQNSLAREDLKLEI